MTLPTSQDGVAEIESDGSAGIVSPQSFTFAVDQPLVTESGGALSPVRVCYETYGRLNERRDNAILVCHALTGSAHAAGLNDGDPPAPGWWDRMIGPGKAFDTDRYFVVCSNTLGSCYGTTGPADTDPTSGKPYRLSFPIVTIRDMVEAQRHLMDHLGIPRWLTITGGSLGGMQAIEWAIHFPDRVLSVIPIATSAGLSPQGIAFNEVGRRAILSDPYWRDGNYDDFEEKPDKGLAIARMIGHITYLSEASMQHKFGRRGQPLSKVGFDLDPQFEVESYLQHQGNKFTRRFDANSYLYITKAMDLYDLRAESGSLKRAFARTRSRWLVISFSSDWLFPSAQAKEIVNGLRANLADVTYYEVESEYGHDAFLLEHEELTSIITMFLNRVAAKGESQLARGSSKI